MWLTVTNGILANMMSLEAWKVLVYYGFFSLAAFRNIIIPCEQAWASQLPINISTPDDSQWPVSGALYDCSSQQTCEWDYSDQIANTQKSKQMLF